MRFLPLILISVLLLSACDMAPDSYANHPLKRRVNVDDHWIYVVPQGADTYVAWGGEDDKDGFVQYRQKRAIELISKCSKSTVISDKAASVLRARVNC